MSLMDRKEIPVNRKNLNVLRRNQDRHTPDIMEIPGEVRKPDNYMETPDAPKSLEYQPEERIFDPRPGGDQRPKSEANRNQFQIPEKNLKYNSHLRIRCRHVQSHAHLLVRRKSVWAKPRQAGFIQEDGKTKIESFKKLLYLRRSLS